MPQETEVKNKREHDFRLHRKYLLVTNFIGLLYLVGEVTIHNYSILGTKISFKNEDMIPTFLGLLFVYSLLRYFQYYITIHHEHFLLDLRSDSKFYFYRLLGKKAWALTDTETNKNWDYEVQLVETSTNNVTQKSVKFLSDPRPDYFMILLSLILAARELMKDSSKQISKSIKLGKWQWMLLKLVFYIRHIFKHPNFMECWFPFILSFLTILLFVLKQLNMF